MVSLEQTGNTLTLLGSLDVDGACELFPVPLQYQSGTMWVDISGVDDIDTAGLALLVHWQQQASDKDTRLIVTGAREKAASLARMYGLATMLAEPESEARHET